MLSWVRDFHDVHDVVYMYKLKLMWSVYNSLTLGVHERSFKRWYEIPESEEKPRCEICWIWNIWSLEDMFITSLEGMDKMTNVKFR